MCGWRASVCVHVCGGGGLACSCSARTVSKGPGRAGAQRARRAAAGSAHREGYLPYGEARGAGAEDWDGRRAAAAAAAGGAGGAPMRRDCVVGRSAGVGRACWQNSRPPRPSAGRAARHMIFRWCAPGLTPIRLHGWHPLGNTRVEGQAGKAGGRTRASGRADPSLGSLYTLLDNQQ